MDAQPSFHPSPESLDAYGLGRLDEELAAVIARHLEACPECRRRVAEAAPDTFLDRLRDAQAGPAIPGSGAGGPTVDPAATGASPMVSDDTRTAVEDGPDGAGLQPGTRVGYFGDYELQRVLGEGGMGIVYRARQLSLNRPVALKMIRATRFPSADEVRRFQNEAEAVARLDHPNIVPIFEVGRFEDQHYFSMKLIAGESLDKQLKEYVADPRRAARLVAVTADAIHHAHQRGILHRDLKPANILVDSDGQPHVTDFGLAKRVEGDSGLTRSGAIIGTPAYMAPEQASGKTGTLTTSTDVYGLGAILYALLTGRAPFSGTTVLDTLDQLRDRPPDSPRKLNQRVPRDLDVICLKCLEKDPRRRYASADALADDLRRWLQGEPIAARRVGRGEHLLLWCRRSPAVAVLLAAVALLSVTFAIGSTWAAVRFRDLASKEREAANNESKATARAAMSEQQARAQAELAGLQANEARALAGRLAQEKALSNRRLYGAVTNLAERAWHDGQIDLMVRYLDDQVPRRPEAVDLRGFEWYYLQHLRHRALLTVNEPAPNEFRAYYEPNIVVSSDGRRFAYSDGQSRVIIRDFSTGKALCSLPGDATRVAFSPDEREVVTSGNPGGAPNGGSEIVFWDAAAGQRHRALVGHSAAVQSMAFSPNGQRLASVAWSPVLGGEGELKVWHVGSASEIWTLKPDNVRFWSVAFHPDGQRLAVATWDRRVLLLSAETGEELLTFRIQASSLAFSPDGRWLATGDPGDQSVRLWEVATGHETKALRGHTDLVTCIAFSPDSQRLVSGGWDNVVRVWDIDSGLEVSTLRGHSGSVYSGIFSVAFSPDMLRIISISRDGVVKIWDATSGQEARGLVGHASKVACVTFSPDGRRIASAGLDHTVRIWDSDSGIELKVLRGHRSWVEGVAFSPDGLKLASCGDDGTIRLWDANTGRELRVITGHKSRIWGVSFSPDGRRIASASQDRTVKVWNANSGSLVGILTDPDSTRGSVHAARFSPDGRKLASACWDDAIRLWDSATLRLISVLRPEENPTGEIRVFGQFTDLAFSPDGRLLAGACDDKTVRVWEVSTGHSISTLRGHRGKVRSVVFTPDGQRVASAGDDGVKVWDSITGHETLSLAGQGGDWISLAISPDGRRMAQVSSQVRNITVWDAESPSPHARIDREAINIIRFFMRQGSTREDLKKRISEAGSIGEPVRRAALALAEVAEEEIDLDELNSMIWSVVCRADARPED